jgi:hypothetical protein
LDGELKEGVSVVLANQDRPPAYALQLPDGSVVPLPLARNNEQAVLEAKKFLYSRPEMQVAGVPIVIGGVAVSAKALWIIGAAVVAYSLAATAKDREEVIEEMTRKLGELWNWSGAQAQAVGQFLKKQFDQGVQNTGVLYKLLESFVKSGFKEGSTALGSNSNNNSRPSPISRIDGNTTVEQSRQSVSQTVPRKDNPPKVDRLPAENVRLQQQQALRAQQEQEAQQRQQALRAQQQTNLKELRGYLDQRLAAPINSHERFVDHWKNLDAAYGELLRLNPSLKNSGSLPPGMSLTGVVRQYQAELLNRRIDGLESTLKTVKHSSQRVADIKLRVAHLEQFLREKPGLRSEFPNQRREIAKLKNEIAALENQATVKPANLAQVPAGTTIKPSSSTSVKPGDEFQIGQAQPQLQALGEKYPTLNAYFSGLLKQSPKEREAALQYLQYWADGMAAAPGGMPPIDPKDKKILMAAISGLMNAIGRTGLDAVEEFTTGRSKPLDQKLQGLAIAFVVGALTPGGPQNRIDNFVVNALAAGGEDYIRQLAGLDPKQDPATNALNMLLAGAMGVGMDELANRLTKALNKQALQAAGQQLPNQPLQMTGNGSSGTNRGNSTGSNTGSGGVPPVVARTVNHQRIAQWLSDIEKDPLKATTKLIEEADTLIRYIDRALKNVTKNSPEYMLLKQLRDDLHTERTLFNRQLPVTDRLLKNPAALATSALALVALVSWGASLVFTRPWGIIDELDDKRNQYELPQEGEWKATFTRISSASTNIVNIAEYLKSGAVGSLFKLIPDLNNNYDTRVSQAKNITATFELDLSKVSAAVKKYLEELQISTTKNPVTLNGSQMESLTSWLKATYTKEKVDAILKQVKSAGTNDPGQILKNADTYADAGDFITFLMTSSQKYKVDQAGWDQIPKQLQAELRTLGVVPGKEYSPQELLEKLKQAAPDPTSDFQDSNEYIDLLNEWRRKGWITNKTGAERVFDSGNRGFNLADVYNEDAIKQMKQQYSQALYTHVDKKLKIDLEVFAKVTQYVANATGMLEVVRALAFRNTDTSNVTGTRQPVGAAVQAITTHRDKVLIADAGRFNDALDDSANTVKTSLGNQQQLLLNQANQIYTLSIGALSGFRKQNILPEEVTSSNQSQFANRLEVLISTVDNRINADVWKLNNFLTELKSTQGTNTRLPAPLSTAISRIEGYIAMLDLERSKLIKEITDNQTAIAARVQVDERTVENQKITITGQNEAERRAVVTNFLNERARRNSDVLGQVANIQNEKYFMQRPDGSLTNYLSEATANKVGGFVLSPPGGNTYEEQVRKEVEAIWAYVRPHANNPSMQQELGIADLSKDGVIDKALIEEKVRQFYKQFVNFYSNQLNAVLPTPGPEKKILAG